MNHQSIHRILSGNASSEEKSIFYKELEQDEVKRNEFIRLKEIWDLNRISQLKIAPQRKKQLLQEFWDSAKIQRQSATRKLFTQWARYAAIFVLALVAGFYMNYLAIQPKSSWKQFHAENGSISSVQLEDGSKIWLNANSTLMLNEQKGKVNAKLTGEAFFNIKHDEDRTFIVNMGKIKVKDLGTSFNISAYPGAKFVRTTLIKGKVSVLDEKDQQIKALEVDQTFTFNQMDHTYKIEQLDPILVTGWKENKFVFIDKPLDEICHEIGEWYGVTIIINGENLKKDKYTSVIRRPSTVKQMLDMFALTTGINYKIEDQNDKETKIYLSK